MQIQVHIIEARELKAENLDGTSDPVVYVECLGQKQNTIVIQQVSLGAVNLAELSCSNLFDQAVGGDPTPFYEIIFRLFFCAHYSFVCDLPRSYTFLQYLMFTVIFIFHNFTLHF